MVLERIDLYKYFGIKRESGAEGYLNAYISHTSNEYCGNRVRPAMLVIPGGGYQMRSDRENEPVAFKFLAEGYNCFTLEYSLNPLGYPTQLIEGAMAVAYIKENAEKMHILKDKVCAIGFSAGGHLAGMLATLYDAEPVKDALKEKSALAKLNAVILSYPVISAFDTHEDTMNTISNNDRALREYLSLENRVNTKSVPAFIWATFDDNDVPSTNSMKMATAYQKNGVKCELHMFKSGVHGLSLATNETAREGDVRYINPEVAKWFDMSISWLKGLGFDFIK
ncbi:MAG: alpha/beta hydrolase [Clostridia bacterium]|nr:alpha/beta hydrolase [Clostridia bacterium]